MRCARELLLILGAAFALVGCARHEGKTDAGGARAASPASVENRGPGNLAAAGAAKEPPAQSSLAIKRGVLALAPERSTFQPCDDTRAFALLDQTDGALVRAFGGDAPTSLYVEAYGERIAAAPSADEMFVLEEVLYAGPQGETSGCAAVSPSYIVAARGTEPFWAVEVGDAQIIWRQPDEPKEIILGPPQPQDAEGAVLYRANGAGHDIQLLIDARACRDGMSGEFFAYSATATLDGEEFDGCARVGR